jgi:EmrB/QacA subfamily drug resistance transporter
LSYVGGPMSAIVTEERADGDGIVVRPVNHDRRWWILGVLGVAQLMVILDTTIVNIALPTAQHALQFSNADRQWIVTAYSLAFGSLLLLGGRISDIVGRKRTLMIGLVGFAAASAIGGASVNFTMLVSARTLQGAFGALLAPAVLALLTTTFSDPGERGKAFGVYGAIAGAGGALGLLLGGILTSYVSWRWTLFVNLGIAPFAVAGAALWLKNDKAADHDPLDYPGILAVTSGLFALVFGFSHAETTSWSDPFTIGFLVLGVVLLAAFTYLQTQVAHPLLPLRVVLNRTRGGSLLAMLFAGAGLFGVFLFLTYYLQDTLGFSPVQTGLAFLPMVAALATTAQFANRSLLPRFGPKPLVPTGLLMAALSLLMLHRLGLHSSYPADILPYLLLMGVGFGLSVAPSFSTATIGVAPHDAGVASASVNTAQQVGGSIGTALLNTLAASAGTAYLVGRLATTSTLRLAALHSYTTAFLWSALIFVLGAVVTGLILERGGLAALGTTVPETTAPQTTVPESPAPGTRAPQATDPEPWQSGLQPVGPGQLYRCGMTATTGRSPCWTT